MRLARDERCLGATPSAPSGVLSTHSGSYLLLCGARGRSRTGTAKAEGFSYQLQLSLLRHFLKAHLWSGLSLYRIAKQHYEVGRSRQVSTLSLALARYEATVSMLSVAA